MDRMEEYAALLDELNELPPALDGAVPRARSRYKKAKTGRLFGIPAATLGGLAAAFVLLVNFSVPFARACGGVPFLKALAAAAAFSPSLKAAVENQYVQPVEQSRTVNGISMTVEYLIVDQKQVNIFYTLESDEYAALWGTPQIDLPDGEGGFSVVSGGFHEDGGLQKITVDFVERDTPAALTLGFQVQGGEGYSASELIPAPSADSGPWDDGGETEPPACLAEFTFELRFDPTFTETGEIYPLNQTLELDGQRVTVTDVEIYPTHLRLNLRDDPGNTAWLRSLDFYLTDERGNRYDKISNGVSATGSVDSPFYASHRLESSYFGNAEHLTVHIAGAVWLDKGRETATVDLKNGTAENLPQGVTLGGVKRVGNDVRIILFARVGGEGSGTPMGTDSYSVASWDYYDPEGGEHRFERMSSSGGFRVDGELEHPDGVPAGCFSENFVLEDYPWDTVELGVAFSRYTVFDAPVSFPVK